MLFTVANEVQLEENDCQLPPECMDSELLPDTIKNKSDDKVIVDDAKCITGFVECESTKVMSIWLAVPYAIVIGIVCCVGICAIVGFRLLSILKASVSTSEAGENEDVHSTICN